MKPFAVLAALLPATTIGRSLYQESFCSKPPAFFLAGDSTTAVQAANGGGWGNGFLSFLHCGGIGANYGHNGATTVSFVAGGDWKTVMGRVKESKGKYDAYVTIQVCVLGLS
jgi:hypothetical protein